MNEELLKYLFVSLYAIGGVNGLNDEFRVTFDHMGGRDTDSFNIEDSSIVSKHPQEKHYF